MVLPNHYAQLPKKRRVIPDSAESESVIRSLIDFYTHSSLSINSPFLTSKKKERVTFWRPWNDDNNRHPNYSLTLPRETHRTSEEHFQTKPPHHSREITSTDNHTQKCQKCSQEFTRRDNLTRHMKSKHNLNSRPECRFCFKILSRKDAVQRHEVNCRHQIQQISF